MAMSDIMRYARRPPEGVCKRIYKERQEKTIVKHEMKKQNKKKVLTGRDPGWPGDLKLPGAAVWQTYKYYTPGKQCLTYVTYL